MKTTALHLTFVLLAGSAVAQKPPEGKGHRPPPPLPPILAIFDVDHDGVISSKEIRHASKALETIDKNGDNQITREELGPPPTPPSGGQEGPPPGHRPPPPVIAALDSNKDGTLSADELNSAPESLLTLDKNGDGELSPQELFPHGPPPPPPGDPDDGPDDPAEPE